LLKGGLGAAVLEVINKNKLENIEINSFGYDDTFIEHEKIEELEKKYGLSAEKIVKKLV